MYYKNVQNIEQNTFNLRAIFFNPCFTTLPFVVNVCVYMEVCIAGEPEQCLKKKRKKKNCVKLYCTMVFNFTGLN